MDLSMNKAAMASLKEATRLTQAGKLQEATAMIQQALSGASSPEDRVEPSQATPDEQTRGETIEGSCRVVEESGAGDHSKHKAKDSDVKARRATVQPEQAQTAAPRKSFTTGLHVSALQDLLREKLWCFDGPDSRPSSSAEELPEGTSFTSGTFTNHAGSRGYKLYIPSGYHGQPLPLVVMLHGCTQNPDDFATGTGMNGLAETQSCLVLYPAQPASANHSKCWNWFKASDQQREHGEPSIIAGMTRKVLDEYHLDKSRVYVAGLSAGGAMAATLAMTYPDLYAAVGVHSGLPHGVAQDLPAALAAMQGGSQSLSGLNRRAQAQVQTGSSKTPAIPMIVFHGDRDTTVHPSNGDRVAAQCLASSDVESASAKAANSETKKDRVPNGHGYTCTVHHGANGRARLEQWSIHGAGHAWSGGASRGSYTDPKGPDASKEILRFFLTHSKTTD